MRFLQESAARATSAPQVASVKSKQSLKNREDLQSVSLSEPDRSPDMKGTMGVGASSCLEPPLIACGLGVGCFSAVPGFAGGTVSFRIVGLAPGGSTGRFCCGGLGRRAGSGVGLTLILEFGGGWYCACTLLPRIISNNEVTAAANKVGLVI